MEVVNPATGRTIRAFAPHTDEEVARKLGQAQAQFHRWRIEAVAERAQQVGRVSEALRRRKEDLARLMAEEMGKPVAQGRAEVDKCAWVAEYYAEHGAGFLATEEIRSDASRSYIAYEPLGVVLAIMPWNFPLWQAFRCVVPALVAGNGVLLKHASNVPGAALAIESLFEEAGLPSGLCSTVLIPSAQVPKLIQDSRIVAVSLTGSTEAGRSVARCAGENLKKCVLELGGSDAYVVLADADLPAAAELCTKSRLINSGQSCIAAKRLVVVEEVRSEFETLLVANMRKAVVGDPLDEATEVGPLARTDLRNDLHEQVTKSITLGARRLLGGELPVRDGAWYPPTVLAGVLPGMPAYEEELFGPVAAIISACDEEEAIEIANDSVFGLGAAVFTGDPARGLKIATHSLEAGACFVNTFVRSDPRLPFGGVKTSGYGRELAAIGIREFVNIKTVYLA